MTLRNHTFNYYRRGTLDRWGYLWKTLVFPGALIAMSLVYVLWLVVSNLVAPPLSADMSSPVSMAVSIALLIVSLGILAAAIYFVPSLTVGRLRGAGRSTWWALLLFAPYVNVLLLIALLFLPEQHADQMNSQTPPEAASNGAADDRTSAVAPLPPAGALESVATPQSTQPAIKATKAKRILVTVGSVASFLIIVALARGGGQLLGQFIRSGVDGVTQSNSAQSFLSNKQLKEYVSSEQGFRAVFPGFPSIDRQTLTVRGYHVPSVTYSASVEPNHDARFIYVWDYSAMPGAADSIDNEGALNGMVQNIQGGRLVSSTPATLGGLAALEGYFTTPVDGQSLDSYARIAHRGTRMYGAMAMGLSKADFDDFAGSFQLTQ